MTLFSCLQTYSLRNFFVVYIRLKITRLIWSASSKHANVLYRWPNYWRPQNSAKSTFIWQELLHGLEYRWRTVYNLKMWLCWQFSPMMSTFSNSK